MTKQTLLFLADAFTALATIATKHANADGTLATMDTGSPAPDPADTTEKPRRGRPPKSTTTEAPAEPVKEETPGTPPPAEEKPAEEKPNLAEIRKAAAKPLIEGGQGKAVKALLGKYNVANISSIADADHEKFLADIEALEIAG